MLGSKNPLHRSILVISAIGGGGHITEYCIRIEYGIHIWIVYSVYYMKTEMSLSFMKGSNISKTEKASDQEIVKLKNLNPSPMYSP